MYNVVGRLAWTEDNEYQTPWCHFRTITEFKKWCAEMRKAQGKPGNKLKSEYIYVAGLWTPEQLLAKVREEHGQQGTSTEVQRNRKAHEGARYP